MPICECASHELCSISHPPARRLRNGFPESPWARADGSARRPNRAFLHGSESAGGSKDADGTLMARAPGRRDQPQPMDVWHGRPLGACGSRGPHHGIRVPFSQRRPYDPEIVSTTNPPTLPVMTLANIGAPGSKARQEGESFCASRSLPSAPSTASLRAASGNLHCQFGVPLVAAPRPRSRAGSVPAQPKMSWRHNRWECACVDRDHPAPTRWWPARRRWLPVTR
jgi:hypothetical protein